MNERLRRIRRFFFTGLVVLAPVGVTAIVLVWIFRTLDEILGGPMQDALGFRVPGLGFVLLGIAVLVIGWIVHQAAGRQVLHWWNRVEPRSFAVPRDWSDLQRGQSDHADHHQAKKGLSAPGAHSVSHYRNLGRGVCDE